MALSKTLKAALVVAILAGVLALTGFILGLLAYLDDKEYVETTQVITLENHTDLNGATKVTGTFIPRIELVANGSFGTTDHGASAAYTTMAQYNDAGGTTGMWSKAGDLVYFQSTVRWDLSGGTSPVATITDEVRLGFESGEIWPIAKAENKDIHFIFQMEDDLGWQYNGSTNQGQMHGMMVANGSIVLLHVQGFDVPWNPVCYAIEYENLNDGFGVGAVEDAIGKGATWFEFRVQGVYNITSS